MHEGLPVIASGQHSRAGRKPRNDDSYGVLVPRGAELEHKGIAMAIADGMSSSEGAKVASETCVRSFLEDYFATPESWTVKKSVATVLKATNNWLNAQSQARDSDQTLVSTFSGVILKAGTAHIFHTGDTRILLLRDGTIEPLTEDHKVHLAGSREYLARGMGLTPNIEIDYRTEPLLRGDILLFTSDGVHEHVQAASAARILENCGADLDGAAQKIVDRAFENGSQDNLTCQIVRIENPGRLDAAGHSMAASHLPFPPELEAGQVFDGYKIVREIHSSNRSQVHLAEDCATGSLLALKTPSRNFEDDPEYIEMFTREEWIGRLISSPHVLKIVSSERPRRFLYSTAEFFDSTTLRQWMFDNPKPPLADVRSIVEQIAKGLRAFHRKDIVHRDLKPENILVDRHGLVKIIDFGSSRAASQIESDTAIDAKQFAGTADYTAPEFHAGDNGSNRSDIFSLGAIAYEMLTGKLPYERGFSNQRDAAKLKYVAAHTLRDDIPIWVDAALARAVAKKPTERTDALSAFVADVSRPNPSLGYDRPVPLIERNPLLFWKGLCTVLLVFVVTLLFVVANN